jgi:hypothetical protein
MDWWRYWRHRQIPRHLLWLIERPILVFFFGVGGLTLGISSGATMVIYFIFWISLKES